MPRVNIYLPDDVYELVNRWRATANLSEICARAIRDELDAVDTHRSANALLNGLHPSSDLEIELARRYGLFDAVTVDVSEIGGQTREALGRAAAKYLDQNICDGALLGIAGGRQTWCVVRNLSPRRVKTTITALGLCQTDPRLLHAHPNTLTTLLWLLYGPRSEAHVIGSGFPSDLWSTSLPYRDHPSYFILASCSPFHAQSPFASLLGGETSEQLLQRDVVGDFAYIFLNDAGDVVPTSFASPHSALPATLLQTLSTRTDARILLVAGGEEKFRTIESTLKAGVCNCIVTDTTTARRLVDRGE